MKCIQCGSKDCGVDVCRFSGLPHAEFERVRNLVNSYADAMSTRDASVRHEGRTEHDMTCSGLPLKPGR